MALAKKKKKEEKGFEAEAVVNRDKKPEGPVKDQFGKTAADYRAEKAAGTATGTNYQIGRKVLTKEEYDLAKRKLGIGKPLDNVPSNVEEAIASRDFPLTLDQHQRAEIEKRIQERNKTEELTTESLPITTEQPVIEQQLEEPTPQQEYAVNPNTGELEPLYSGGVTPITAEDLTDVVSLFAGAGIVKIGGKKGYQTLLKKASKNALPEAEAYIVKKCLLKSLTKKVTSKIGTLGLGIVLGQITAVAGYYVSNLFTKKASAPDRQIQSIDSGMSQVRETITLPVQLALAGAPLDDCLEQIDMLRAKVDYGDSRIKELKLKSNEMKTNPEFTFAAELRIQKLNGFLDLAERQIISAQVKGDAITTEQLNDLLNTYEELFGEERMETNVLPSISQNPRTEQQLTSSPIEGETKFQKTFRNVRDFGKIGDVDRETGEQTFNGQRIVADTLPLGPAGSLSKIPGWTDDLVEDVPAIVERASKLKLNKLTKWFKKNPEAIDEFKSFTDKGLRLAESWVK